MSTSTTCAARTGWRCRRCSNGGSSQAFNLGNGNGFSVQEVIDAAQRVTGRPVPVQYVERRSGDPARLVADASRAVQLLGWKPQFAALDTLIEHAWAWEQRSASALHRT